MYERLAQLGETITHLVAFLIFFWIMWKFAWPAIINLLSQRQEEIAKGFADIENKQAELTKMQEDYAAKLSHIEQEARVRIQEAVADGRRVAGELTEKARAEAQEITDRAKRSMELELDKARIELRDEVASMVVGASERLLRAKLDEQADRRLVDSFISDLGSKN